MLEDYWRRMPQYQNVRLAPQVCRRLLSLLGSPASMLIILISPLLMAGIVRVVRRVSAGQPCSAPCIRRLQAPGYNRLRRAMLSAPMMHANSLES